jgi:hypothetical protein
MNTTTAAEPRTLDDAELDQVAGGMISLAGLAGFRISAVAWPGDPIRPPGATLPGDPIRREATGVGPT